MPGIVDVLTGPVSKLVSEVGKVIDNLHTSEEEKQAAKLQLTQLANTMAVEQLKHAEAEIAAQRDVIVAEAQGESWLQRSWRPITMLSFVAIVVNNYILVPYATAFGLNVPMLEIPNGMWALLTTGVGGYVVSRGVEKSLRIRNGNGNH